MPAPKRAAKKADTPLPEGDMILWLEDARVEDVPRVGGKNASLGEMIANLSAMGVDVPGGFATTADAYRHFVAENGLDAIIREQTDALAKGSADLADVGKTIRKAFLKAKMPAALSKLIAGAYRDLGAREGKRTPDVAVRSSLRGCRARDKPRQ